MLFRLFLGVSSLFLLVFLLFALVRRGAEAATVLPFDESGASAAGLLMGKASLDNRTNGTSVCQGSGFVGQKQLYLPLVTSNNSHAATSQATSDSKQAVHPIPCVGLRLLAIRV